jgi:dihydrodipicolinate synthase/N-acetylneuraminate lyase
MCAQIYPGRKIEGISAILLPYDQTGQIDYDGVAAHIARTLALGLTPAINMDTGYVNLLTQKERRAILAVASQVCAGQDFIAGAFVEGQQGPLSTLYGRETDTIQSYGGVPILFQCSALKQMRPDQIVALYQAVAGRCTRLLAFELGEMFAPFGMIYPLEVVRAIMEIPQITGMKHSSLKRMPEWQRLELRQRVRPDFKIYTGNDLAIDMVMYGSDYLLGLSTFAPDYFARRDAAWLAGDPAFYELNDVLQYLGQFAFRAPVAAYKHSAAQFLKLRGWITCDAPPPGLQRPQSDLDVLRTILGQLEAL